jgi:hypothetical protein
MKNKGITILLLFAVFLIWGAFFYKVFRSNENSITTYKTRSFKPDFKDAYLDTYKIHVYYRDPFLSILTDTVTEPIEIIKVSKPVEKKNIVLPLFFGLIKNGKTITAIFKVKKRMIFLHEGDCFQHIKIKKVTPDSVVCVVEGQNVAIPLLKMKKGNVKRE